MTRVLIPCLVLIAVSFPFLLPGTGVVPALAQSADELATLNARASELYQQGRYAEAIGLAEDAVRLAERNYGPGHFTTGMTLNNLGALYRALGRYAEAEPLFKRGLEIAEGTQGPDHPNVGTALGNLAGLYQEQGRFAEAEGFFKRALAITETALGPNDSGVGVLLNNLAALYDSLGRYADAEPLYRRAVGIFEAVLGSEHPDLATLLNNFGELYERQGRHDEAEPLLKRALSIAEKTLPPDSPRTAAMLGNLAALYRKQGRTTDAEPLFRRSLAMLEKALGPQHPEVGASLNNLGQLLLATNRQTEAEPFLVRAHAIAEQALGHEHPQTASRLNDLAVLRRTQERYEEASRFHLRALVIREKALGPDHPDVGQSLNNLASLAYLQADWASAAKFWRRSVAIMARRMDRDADRLGQPLTGEGKSEAERLAWQFWGLVKAGHRLSGQTAVVDAPLSREMFIAAQWGLSSQTSASVAQMAARGAKGDAALGVLIRERQDLLAEWQNRDRARSAALARPADKRDQQAEAENLGRLTAIDARISAIDNQLGRDFPDYAALANPAPLSIDEVQVDLREDEALVFFLDTADWHPLPEETFIWVITKRESRWVRSPLGTRLLAHEVSALRCGLDLAAWSRDAARAWCSEALGRNSVPALTAALPFDHGRAHKLYKALFSPLEDLIAGKHLLVVPSGALTQLPFHVLVTDPPSSADHRTIAWLPRRHALTVLPSVFSLKALRRVARPSTASKPFIGFGNPLLDGPDSRYAEQARLARVHQSCLPLASPRVTARRGAPVPLFGLRGGLADPAHVRAQVPLPETADELCTVARSSGGDPSDVRLGASATEREVKALSASGALAQYRVVHFASHGALAGQLTGTAEPGLILTPPDSATTEDDGYLSASEIAALKLDADWVILSACNTAAGGATGAEALSGLARAFFYAQARALLVSHWAVDSDATVKLVTATAKAATLDRSVGRAEALRRAMLALIDTGTPHEAHPSFWAPFVVVGEGAAK